MSVEMSTMQLEHDLVLSSEDATITISNIWGTDTRYDPNKGILEVVISSGPRGQKVTLTLEGAIQDMVWLLANKKWDTLNESDD